MVEAYGENREHPVGTGRSGWPVAAPARIVLAQPGYREVFTTKSRRPTTRACRPSPRSSRGRRLPLMDRVEIAIIEEQQPRWLSFLNEQTRT